MEIKKLHTGADFNGPEYDPQYDKSRLTGQIYRVWDLMKDGKWRTLREIAYTTGDPEASVSAQLRHLRKPRFGEFFVDRQPRGKREGGLFEYRLLPEDPAQQVDDMFDPTPYCAWCGAMEVKDCDCGPIAENH